MAPSSSTSPPLITTERKWEILGLLLMALAVLVGIALVTYSPSDQLVARNFSLTQALDPTEAPVSNALGLIGAVLSHYLIPQFLGYPVLIVVLFGFIWGYRIFRHRATDQFGVLAGVVSLLAIFFACAAGWIGLVFEVDVELFSGSVGIGITAWLEQLLGFTGAALIILVGIASTLLLVFDHDIQRSMDRLEQALAATGRGIKGAWSGLTNWIQSSWQSRRKRSRAKTIEQEETRSEEPTELDRSKADSSAESRDTRTSAGTPTNTGREKAGSSRGDESESSPIPGVISGQDAADKHTSESGSKGTNGTSETITGAAESTPSSSSNRSEGETTDASRQQTDPTSASDVEPELHIQEQVEEEKANLDNRSSDRTYQQSDYEFPSVELLEPSEDHDRSINYEELETNKRILLDKLETYNVEITDIQAVVGPTVTLYELTPARDVRVSRITSLEDDLAMAMAADGIRMIAPIPGKSAIGVEIPNKNRELVRIRDILNTTRFQNADMELPVALGKTIEGEVYVRDLTKMPHLLIAGATGSGKSVGINSLITCLLYSLDPSSLKFVLIDPKKIELLQYQNLLNHYIATPEDAENPILTEFEEAVGTLKSCEKEMETRYDLLSQAGVRGIVKYNEKFRAGELDPDEGHRHLPYIVVIIDELADLMITSGKDIESPIARLAQMARAVGIHLVLATQRPSVDVITGLIKANFPSRIAYQVASKVDSRTILDQGGAEQLVGNGDMLYMNGSRIDRLQGPYVSVDEVEEVTTFIGRQKGTGPYELPPIDENAGGLGDTLLPDAETDELFEDAARIIVRHQQGSVSLLQRKLAVGYTRAARIVDQLEEANIVGPFRGSRAREVNVESEEQLDELLSEQEDEE